MPVLRPLAQRLAHRIAADDTSRPLWRHPATIAAAVLALTLGAVPLLPDGDEERDAITPAAESAPRAGTAGRGRVTTEMRAEIERVVAAGAVARLAQGRTAAARAAVRCATFDGQRYCLGFGWTNQSRETLTARLESPPVFGRRAERTGDLDADGVLGRAMARSDAEREEAERAELTMAAQSVGKVWMLRHEVQGVALPEDFAEDHPEVTTGSGIDARGGYGASYPTKDKILTSKVAKAQHQTWWCGPATMQAIGWSSQGQRKTQAYWARRLGTTSAGTAISDMVRVANNKTDYDEETAAGPYVVLDISDFTFKQWYRVMMRHITDYRAPVILHPVLLKQYYPYLDDDASGHFQVGRGFDQDPDGNRKIGYFEPWDQSRFDPSEPAIERVQWRNAYKSYRANLDHFQHNIGV
ncbi:C39 family peptidase [Nocardioides KLBMP 9356]|uniref:C39 family peptidase n=1 Tax=Nocardioides potassii TaxID=2911371 RepID=A0ABS9H6H0_9ACTN|nr:C39 family peptidase [Nocardioides potassii]MCF6376034.1 C39 family peptidase [Nocardioides potassii]